MLYERAQAEESVVQAQFRALENGANLLAAANCRRYDVGTYMGLS